MGNEMVINLDENNLSDVFNGFRNIMIVFQQESMPDLIEIVKQIPTGYKNNIFMVLHKPESEFH